MNKGIINAVDTRLVELVSDNKTPKLLRESMEYSLTAGGKRLRPLLNILSHLLIAPDYSKTLDIACAIEMIHTYSLIHDDLPAMDNDSLRRGMPTNHIVFGEGQAILAGDGLLNLAYEVMINNAIKFYSENQLKAISIVAYAAGVRGMIAGQVLDISMAGKKLSYEELRVIHLHKTGSMISGAVMSGAAAAGASDAQMQAVKKYGENIGLAFQIIDDILDQTSSAKELGKTPGKDNNMSKTTYMSMFGKEAYIIAKDYTNAACDAISIFGGRAHRLIDIANIMLDRTK